MEPEGGDEAGEGEGAGGVDPPAQFGAQDAGEDAEAVDEEVVAVVEPEDADLRVVVAEGEAVEEEEEFGGEGDGDGDGGGEVEGDGEVAGGRAGEEAADGEGDEEEGDGGHQEAEDDVAGGFDAGFAGGEFARVHFGDGAVAEEEGEVGGWVEDGVGHGGEEGEGAGSYGRVGLEDGEEEVGGEGAVDGDLVAEVVGAVGFFGLTDVFVDGFEEPLDA